MSGWSVAGKGCSGRVVQPSEGAAYRHPSCASCARGSPWSTAAPPPEFDALQLCPQRLPL